jgi:hypothetical protein
VPRCTSCAAARRTADGYASGEHRLPRRSWCSAQRRRIGLYRTEFLYFNRTDMPTKDEHYGRYRH